MSDNYEYRDNLIDPEEDANRDVGVEKALLALCMRNPKSVIQIVGNNLDASDFSDERNAYIYSAIISLFYENQKVDRFSVTHQLEKTGQLDRAGGLMYVYGVADEVAVVSNIDTYLDSIRDNSERRKLIATVNDIRTKILSGKLESGREIDYAISTLSELKRTEDSKGFETLKPILKRLMANIRTEIDTKGDGGKIKTGFRKLDNMLGGLRPGSLNILAARPGMGKTALAINIASNVAANGTPVAIFSLEMSKEEIGNRLLSSCMDKPVNQILFAHRMSDNESAQLDAALQKLSDFPIIVDDNSNSNPVTMKSKLTELFSDASTRPGLIIIDYLQLITLPNYGGRSRNEEVSQISRSLKVLAKDFGVPILALSQLSRGAAQRDDHTPQLSDLRESGAIEQDADTVMFIDRPDYYKKKEEGQEAVDRNADIVEDAYIYLEKNRHGATKRVKVCWIAKRTLFYEPDDYVAEESQASPFKRTQSQESSAQDYNFDRSGTEPQEPAEPEEAPDEGPEDDGIFTETNDDFPDTF
ncbi:MAG: replicative DNA helicase [Saccharofermentans sp.]|nr:replicative DNA helicase [Saccharofermentans sp.]